MGKDTEFLNYIYQNAKMGVVGIDNIKLKYINLTNNLLSDKGVYYVSRFTSKIKSIEQIDLRNNLYNREKIELEIANKVIDNRIIL